MSTHHRSRAVLLATAFFLCLTAARGQGVAPLGGEMDMLNSPPGDQVWPALSLSSTGGILMWEDNMIGGKGGVGGAQLDANFNVQCPTYRIPKSPLGDQFKAKVQLLHGGKSIYVWESKVLGTPDIYVRFMNWNRNSPARPTSGRIFTPKTCGSIPMSRPWRTAGRSWSGPATGRAAMAFGKFLRGNSPPPVSARRPRNFRSTNLSPNKPARPWWRWPTATTWSPGFPVGERDVGAIVPVGNCSDTGTKWAPPGSIDIYARVFTSADVPVTEGILS